ncbi:MAG: TfoX/Sxy family protein [SAR202 cluster bacterium]|jgi:DNA transformation protein|nr:TfoX/Sxy family protein [SAR202 cluster bacterium]
MAVPDTFRDLVLEKLEPIGDIQVRAMFGGYGVFESGSMFALMAGSGLFFKVDESNRSTYEEAGSKQYGRMPYFRVPESVLEDSGTLQDWARISVTVGRAASKNKKK